MASGPDPTNQALVKISAKLYTSVTLGINRGNYKSFVLNDLI
jgi:hypothetical protein